MPTDAEYEAAMKRVYGDKKGGKKPTSTKKPDGSLRKKIKRRMDRIDEITRNGTTPDHTKRV